jgi:hypothetical protein
MIDWLCNWQLRDSTIHSFFPFLPFFSFFSLFCFIFFKKLLLLYEMGAPGNYDSICASLPYYGTALRYTVDVISVERVDSMTRLIVTTTPHHHHRTTMNLSIVLLLHLVPVTAAMSPITAPAPVPPESIKRFYPIGTPGHPWNAKEDDEWRASVKWNRSYQEQVVDKVEALKKNEVFQKNFVVDEYGCIDAGENTYPLFAIRSQGDWNSGDEKTLTMLVTGGVHGYETSGVQGALLFVQQLCGGDLQEKYLDGSCHICVCPCVTPWAYEHIQRWNAELKDPNRSFQADDALKTKESAALMSYLAQLTAPSNWHLHLDLHETTDTDLSEFMPAKHAKAGLNYEGEVIPDGFYMVGCDVRKDQVQFNRAIIESVKKVTHIADPDSNGNIIDEPMVSEGVILVPVLQLGLCCSVLIEAPYVGTTEVYPDSPRGITDEQCNQAQVAAITGAIDYVRSCSLFQ